jgi:SAM-dependent methyltransferase
MHDCRQTWYLPGGSGERWAEDYEHGRPGWPPAIVRIPSLPSAATVLDLAAGTGKLTRLLIPIFDRVIAVEPQQAQRHLLVRICPDAEVLAGTAEKIPLTDASVDAVFIAEAFHLFGNERTVAEIARVLRVEGAFVLLWNLPAGPWEPSIAAAERLLRERLPRTQEFTYDPLDLNPHRHASGEWRQAFRGSLFENLQSSRLPNPHSLKREGLVAFLASMGWIADLADEDRLPLLEEVKLRLTAAEYRRSWETYVYWTRLSDRPRAGIPTS